MMDKIDELLIRGVDKIYPSKEALEKVLRSGKKLRLYQGFDPTGTELHIGHMVGLMKLRQWQNLGHEVIFLIGDFTGLIGDPSGKIRGARQILSKKQVLINAKDYQKQAGRILKFHGKNAVKLKYNSAWLGKMSAIEFLALTHHLTYSQIVKRELFQQRKKAGQDIYANEFIYPILQAYDSVCMDVDLEIGGSDQMFNMLVGRDLMKKMRNKEKFVMTTPLLTDASGQKIGKTEGNAIALTAEPTKFYGMIMSLPDDVIVSCFENITDLPMTQVKHIKEALKAGQNPMTFKKQLAYTLTKILNGEPAAQTAQKEFERVSQSRGTPSQVTSYKLKVKSWNIVDLLMECHLASSRSDAKRLVQQGGVEVNNQKVTEFKNIKVSKGDIIRAGKRKWARIS